MWGGGGREAGILYPSKAAAAVTARLPSPTSQRYVVFRVYPPRRKALSGRATNFAKRSRETSPYLDKKSVHRTGKSHKY